MRPNKKSVYVRGDYHLREGPRTSGESVPGRFYVYWYDSKTRSVRTRTTQTRDLEAAKIFLDKMYLADGEQAHAHCPSCGKAVAEAGKYPAWLAIGDYEIEVAPSRTSKVSILARLKMVKAFLAATGQTDVTCEAAMKETFIQSMRDWLLARPVEWRDKSGAVTAAKPKSPAGAEEPINQFRAVLNHAYEQGRIDARPRFKTRTRQSLSSPVRTRCDISQLGLMLQYASEGERLGALHAFLVASICTIARPNAVVDISTDPARGQWSPGNPTLNLNPKGRVQTKKFRPLIPVVPVLQNWLNATRLDPASNGWLVNFRGQPVKNVRTAWRNMITDLGLPASSEWGTYILRRSIARMMRAKRVNPWDLQGFMGHRLVKMTEVYADDELFETVFDALCELTQELDVRHPTVFKPRFYRTSH